MTDETTKKPTEEAASSKEENGKNSGSGGSKTASATEPAGTSGAGGGNKEQSTADASTASVKNNKEKKGSDPIDPMVRVGCTIPFGVILEVQGFKVALLGEHAGGITVLPKLIWDEIVKAYQDWEPLRRGSVFLSENVG